jgi:hypothetical protein
MNKVRFAMCAMSAIVCSTIALAQRTQDSSSASGVEILKLHWQKQIRLPNNYDPAIIATRGAFVDPASKAPASLPGSGIDNTRPPNRNPNSPADSDAFFPATPRRLPVHYIYSMKIKNTGNKRIEGVAWTYAFLDRETRTELGRHEFSSYKKIAPGAIGKLENPLRSPPVRVVKATEIQSPQKRLTERATIECILFADETTWRDARASEEVCKALAKGNPAKRKPPLPPRQN